MERTSVLFPLKGSVLLVMHDRNIALSHLLGGSPYPGINARQIATKLQEGFRMPKPKHVDNKL